METTLSASQKAVVDHFPHFLMDEDQHEMTIAGFAGSGKTYLIAFLAEMQDKIQKFAAAIDTSVPTRKLWFTATTNKAAAVLEDMLGVEARTIHSILGLRVRDNYKTGAQELVATSDAEDLTNSIVFIDEASMINRQLLSVIRAACKEFRNCKLVFIGDEYQLPPVKEDVCPVFNDGEHTVRLSEIQRQIAGSPIIQLSAEFRACLDDHTRPWPEIIDDGQNIRVYETKDEYFAAIKNAFTKPHKPTDLKIVAWSNRRVNEYNAWIRRLQGREETLEVGESVSTNKPLMVNNRITAITDSVHTIVGKRPDRQEDLMGYRYQLVEYGPWYFQPNDWGQAMTLQKQFAKDAKHTRNWASYFEIKNEWADLRPVHASTVHKAQGSTYREVFVDLNNIGKNNQWREVARLAYVAITRASHRVHIFGKLRDRYNKGPVIDLMEPFKNVDKL